MAKKKLFILIWDMGPGGIQKRVKDLTNEIIQNYPNWEIYLFIKYKEPHYFLDQIIKDPSLHIIYLNKNRRIRRHIPSIFWVVKQFLIIKPDVCLTFLEQLSITMILTKLFFSWQKKTKVVLNEGVFTSKYLEINRNLFWKNVMKICIRFFYRFADQIIVPTQKIKHELSTSFGIQASKITTIPNWTLFLPGKKNELEKKYDFIYLTRFEKEKNPILFIQCIAEIKKSYSGVKSCLIGEGKLLPDLIKLINDLDLTENISLLPFTNSPREHLLESKILLFTSQNEGMPNTVLEANMCSLPAVSMNFAGANEVILHGKTGFIANSREELIQFALLLLNDTKLQKKIGTQAQNHVRVNFSSNIQKKFIHELLHT